MPVRGKDDHKQAEVQEHRAGPGTADAGVDPPSNRGRLTVWESHDLAQIQ
jgi:hypothetical protein